MELIEISLAQNGCFVVTINLVVAALVIAGIVVLAWVVRRLKGTCGKGSVDVDEASLGIGSSSVTLKFNRKEQEIAYKLWVELSTRKIAIPFDEEHDVISEVYDSWYSFFAIARNLMKEIPPTGKTEDSSLVQVSGEVLNKGLRPHLTKWQAAYRRWYDYAISANGNEGKTPQEIQRDYPFYAELVADIKKVNSKMTAYMNCLKRIAFDEKKPLF